MKHEDFDKISLKRVFFANFFAGFQYDFHADALHIVILLTFGKIYRSFWCYGGEQFTPGREGGEAGSTELPILLKPNKSFNYYDKYSFWKFWVNRPIVG